MSRGSKAEADLAFTAFADFLEQKIVSQGHTFGTGWAGRRLEEVAYAYALPAHTLHDGEAARKYLERGASRGVIIAMQINDNNLVEVSVWYMLDGGKWPECTEHAKS